MASAVVTPPPAPELPRSVEAVRHGGPDRRQRRDPRHRPDGVPEPDPEDDASPPPAGRLDVMA